MVSNIIKNIFLYIGIVIGAILSLIVFLALLMFFVPSFRFFGLGLINENETSQARVIRVADYTQDYINKIDFIISTKSFNVDFIYDVEATDITYYYQSNVIGFTTDKIATRMYKDVSYDNGVLTISITQAEPNGFLYFVDSRVVVTVPVFTTSSDQYQYGILTNTGIGNVSLYGTENNYFNVRYLNVTTTSGNLNLSYVGTAAGSATLSSLVVFTDSGTFDFTGIENITVAAPIQITSNNSVIKFKNIYSGMNIQAQNIDFSANDIVTTDTGFEINAFSGNVNINKLTSTTAENIFISSNCNITVQDIKGKTGVNVTSANVNMVTVRDTVIVKSVSGNVHIKYAFGDLVEVISESGNIIVEDYKANGIFASTTGSINVYSNSDYRKGIKTRLETVDGNVNVKVKANHLVLTTTGQANVSIIFETIARVETIPNSFQHTVTIAGKSSAKVYMPTVDCHYRFKATGVITGSLFGLLDKITGNAYVSSNEEEQYYPGNDLQSQTESYKYATFLFTGGSINFNGYTQN